MKACYVGHGEFRSLNQLSRSRGLFQLLIKSFTVTAILFICWSTGCSLKRFAAGWDGRGNCTFTGLGGILRYDVAVVGDIIGDIERFSALGKEETPDGKSVDILLLSAMLPELFS
jgi:hypothetical protein